MKKNKRKNKITLGSVVVIILLLVAYFVIPGPKSAPAITLEEVPAYSGEPFVVLNENVPNFTEKDYTTKSYEHYDDLDALNRCTLTVACIGKDLMPTEDRGNIGQVKPTGWVTAKYDFVDGKYDVAKNAISKAGLSIKSAGVVAKENFDANGEGLR